MEDTMMITSAQDFAERVEKGDGCLVYYNTNTCSVGESVATKLEALLEEEFPKMQMFYIMRDLYPELAAQHRVFIDPTVVIFFDGKEIQRKSRSFSVDEIRTIIERPYTLFF